MEKQRLEAIREELALTEENLGSFIDNYRAARFRKAASDLYFFLEHAAKALLLTTGIEPTSHEGVQRMISLHFIKPKTIPVEVARYMGNLYERRKTAEYSRNAGWEFNEEEIDTYFEWASISARHFFDLLKSLVPGTGAEVDKLSKRLEFFRKKRTDAGIC